MSNEPTPETGAPTEKEMRARLAAAFSDSTPANVRTRIIEAMIEGLLDDDA